MKAPKKKCIPTKEQQDLWNEAMEQSILPASLTPYGSTVKVRKDVIEAVNNYTVELEEIILKLTKKLATKQKEIESYKKLAAFHAQSR